MEEEICISIEDFLQYLKIEKLYSSHTVSSYQRILGYFRNFLRKKKIRSLFSISTEKILDFVGFLKKCAYADSSIVLFIKVLKSYFRFLKREDYLLKDMSYYLHPPKIPPKIVPILTEGEMCKILVQPNLKSFVGARDKAILEMMYGSGMRVSEICELRRHNLDLKDRKRVLIKRGKGKRDRHVPLGKLAIEALQHYFSFEKFKKYKIPHVFLSNMGNPIARETIWRNVKKYAHDAKISKNISPHTFRHSFATALLHNGADIRIIQEMMGHENIASTEIYLHRDFRSAIDLFHKCHPRP